MEIRLKVECYSGFKADERPLRFTFMSSPDHQQHEVREVLDQWYGSGYQCFKVRADDGDLYILRHRFNDDAWLLDSFRHEKNEA